ncbi:MAG: hypothetical protein LBE25_13650 [Arthrobacter sp.]|nr:hypothetical protein [Arthrobacter sp.]
MRARITEVAFANRRHDVDEYATFDGVFWVFDHPVRLPGVGGRLIDLDKIHDHNVLNKDGAPADAGASVVGGA